MGLESIDVTIEHKNENIPATTDACPDWFEETAIVAEQPKIEEKKIEIKESEHASEAEEIIAGNFDGIVDVVDLNVNKLTTKNETVIVNLLSLLLGKHQRKLKIDEFSKEYLATFLEEITPKSLNCKTFLDFFRSIEKEYPVLIKTGILSIDNSRFEGWIWNCCLSLGKESVIRKVFRFENVLLPLVDYVARIDPKELNINEVGVGLKKAKSVEVKILAVASAASVYVRMKKYEKDIDELMNTIQQKMSAYGDWFKVPVELAGYGLYCIVYAGGSWYRGRIVAVVDDVTVDVELIDYGGSVRTNVKDLRLLTQQLAKLPRLVIRVSLHGIAPIDKETGHYKFTKQPLLQFSDPNAWLKCSFFAKSTGNGYSALITVNNKGKEVSLSDILVEKKLAVAV